MLYSAGEAASEPATTRDCTNRSEYRHHGHHGSCGGTLWISLTTLPTHYWTGSRAPSQIDSDSLPQGQIEEIFPAQSNNSVQLLRLIETLSYHAFMCSDWLGLLGFLFSSYTFSWCLFAHVNLLLFCKQCSLCIPCCTFFMLHICTCNLLFSKIVFKWLLLLLTAVIS